MAPYKRGQWSQHEDRLLLSLITSQTARNWVAISARIGTRSPKQCRERYQQHLNPGLKHGPITLEEGVLIENLVEKLGKQWAQIARHLSGRSDNSVKNWWYTESRRRERQQKNDRQNRINSYQQPLLRYTEVPFHKDDHDEKIELQHFGDNSMQQQQPAYRNSFETCDMLQEGYPSAWNGGTTTRYWHTAPQEQYPTALQNSEAESTPYPRIPVRSEEHNVQSALLRSNHGHPPERFEQLCSSMTNSPPYIDHQGLMGIYQGQTNTLTCTPGSSSRIVPPTHCLKSNDEKYMGQSTHYSFAPVIQPPVRHDSRGNIMDPIVHSAEQSFEAVRAEPSQTHHQTIAPLLRTLSSMRQRMSLSELLSI